MKVTIQEKPEEELTYPYYGLCGDGTIVLFFDSGCGTCIKKGTNGGIVGLHEKDWAEENFTKITSPILIEP